MRVLVLAVVILTAAFSPAGAVPDAPRAHPKLHTLLRAQLARHKSFDATTSFTALVLFARPPSKQRLEELRTHGVAVEDGVAGPLCVGATCGVALRNAGLAWLLDQQDVLEVSGMPPHRPPLPPTQATQALIGLDRVWMRRLQNQDRQQGAGITFLDLDSSIDVFHPLFFRPDGGRYRFLDLDGDGRLTPGVDAVDLDGNGTAGPTETLQVLGGMVEDPDHSVAALAAGAAWLYADENNNRTRDFGKTAGFTEDTPAYGEPLFVLDDVDDDGVLTVGEHLVRLGTSKIKGVYKADTQVGYLRGHNLLDYPDVEDLGHACGVAGILVGGSPWYGKVVGFAPDADLLVVPNDALVERDPSDTTVLLRAVDWGRAQGANIMLHEYGVPVGYHADGSGAWEQALTTLATQGIIQTAAAHNYAAARAQTWLTLAPGETLQVPVGVAGVQGYRLTLFAGGIRWRGAANAIATRLTWPDNTSLDPSFDGRQGVHMVYGGRSASARGTGMVSFFAFDYDNTYRPLPQGTWNLELVNQDSVEHQVHLYVTDDSYYSIFTQLAVETNNTGSMAWPSTADGVVAVGAYAVNVPYRGDGVLQLASYSGRGPRIDGQSTITIVAPADPISASSEAGRQGLGDLDYFGGTSGALPHVAGAIALLLQQQPGLTQVQVMERLRLAGTPTSDSGTLPNDAWGAGLLSVPRLLWGMDAPANQPPTVAVAVPSETPVGQMAHLDASGSTDDQTPAGALRFSFDVGQDGTLESALGGPTLDVPVVAAEDVLVRVSVEDNHGLVSERLVTIHGVPAVDKPNNRIPLLPSCAQGGGVAWAWLVLALYATRRRGGVSAATPPA